jgi:hypothetical protein
MLGSLRALAAWCVWITAAGTAAANPALEGYSAYKPFTDRVQRIDASPWASIATLGTTAGKRDIWAITLGRGETGKKPALVVVGSVQSSHVAGSEIALRMAERIVGEAEKQGDEQAELCKLLEEVTIYVIPRPDPDATEKAFAAPYRAVDGNLRSTDDDRDGQRGEDPPDDLNGDGWITQMRVTDDAGQWMPHPVDPRILIQADPAKNERGVYRVLSEGRDNDGDEQFNEDAGDGVAFHRNWPHRYQAFQPGTGPNAVSETETRAVADFLFDHPNILAVFCFSAEDNLFHPWKADAGKDRQRIRSTVHSADAPFLDFLAGKYREVHGGKDAPEPVLAGGGFAEWSYFQFGRWTFASRGWWIPQVPLPEGEAAKSDEKRGAQEWNALRWFEQQQRQGFVPWQKIDHPDFPGQTVEVGGFKPFYRENPPAGLLDELAAKHIAFLVQLAQLRPRIALAQAKVESLGSGITRVSTAVKSLGYLPTVSEMGRVTKVPQRLQVELVVPEKTEFLKGSARIKLDRIAPGEKSEVSWLVRLPADAAGRAVIRAWSPELNSVEQALDIK